MLLAFAILIDGITYAAWLFLVSVGLTLVFGVLRILNVAHGGLYSFGAYSAAFAVGLCLRNGLGPAWQIAAMLSAAVIVGAVLGAIIERTIIVSLASAHETRILLATYAAFLVLEDLTKAIWGGVSLYANAPRDALGQIVIGTLSYPVYDLLLVAVAVTIAIALALGLSSTRIGRLVTAVVADREIATAMGVNVRRILALTFVTGAALGALAGALTAPKIAVLPGIGVDIIVLAFAVVVIGGLGSVVGAGIGAILIGLVRALSSHLLPEFEIFVIYAVMALVLMLRPYGLIAALQPRRI